LKMAANPSHMQCPVRAMRPSSGRRIDLCAVPGRPLWNPVNIDVASHESASPAAPPVGTTASYPYSGGQIRHPNYGLRAANSLINLQQLLAGVAFNSQTYPNVSVAESNADISSSTSSRVTTIPPSGNGSSLLIDPEGGDNDWIVYGTFSPIPNLLTAEGVYVRHPAGRDDDLINRQQQDNRSSKRPQSTRQRGSNKDKLQSSPISAIAQTKTVEPDGSHSKTRLNPNAAVFVPTFMKGDS